jgi:hypothetical protein
MTYGDQQTSWSSILVADDIQRNRAHKYPAANYDLKVVTGAPIQAVVTNCQLGRSTSGENRA